MAGGAVYVCLSLFLEQEHPNTSKCLIEGETSSTISRKGLAVDGLLDNKRMRKTDM
jgi:hypothetical protein